MLLQDYQDYIGKAYTINTGVSLTPKNIAKEMIEALGIKPTDTELNYLNPVETDGMFIVQLYDYLMDIHKNIILDETVRRKNVLSRLYLIPQNDLSLDIIQSTLKRKDIYDEIKDNILNVDFLEDELNMKFDVIIGNPPYNASGNENTIYDKFYYRAKQIQPRKICYIIPSRWYSGGKAYLDKFRFEMINDTRIKVLVDYINNQDIFPNVEIKGGICYFVWDADYNGVCCVKTHLSKDKISVSNRYLKTPYSDVLIRHNEAVLILDKVLSKKEKLFSSIVSSTNPFGLSTNVNVKESQSDNDVVIYARGGVGYYQKDMIERNIGWLDKYKVYISESYNGGDVIPHQIINQPIFGDKGTCCTGTYIVIGPFDNKEITENVMSYIRTKFFRFLVSNKKISQHASKKVYEFVPMQDFSKKWTDEELFDRYDLTNEERNYIRTQIKDMS